MLCRNPFTNQAGAFPCGQCQPCRINRRRLWTHRLMLEQMSHDHSSFITLTYADEHIPPENSLAPKELSDWLKRFRKSVYPVRVRFYACGEYGEENQRPHYHIAMFGYPSCVYGQTTYRKERISCCENCSRVHDTWSRGRIQCGTLTVESSQYVAGYVLKKMTSHDDPRLNGRYPEFQRQSIGLGSGSIDQIAETLRKFNLDQSMADVPSALQHGKKIFPLGRYLRRKLRKALGRDENAPPETLRELAKELQALRQIQQSNPVFKPLSHYIQEKDRQRSASIEAKSKIFNRRNKL